MRILKEKTLKGYKAFNKDLTCRNMQYEIGKEYEFDGEPIPCRQGFHFCTTIADTYKFYPMEDDTRICEVEAFGVVATDDNVKFCTNKIRIIAEVTEEYLRKANVNKSSSGFCNSGNRNSGNCNSGNRNSGNWNSGNRNSGDRNSGDFNSGDFNSGDFNSGDRCTGVFCTENEPFRMFNKSTDLTYENWRNSRAFELLYLDLPRLETVEWIDADCMSDDEKKANPNYEVTGGYLKVLNIKESSQAWWNSLSKEDKEEVMSLPNFDKDIFEKCTGITIV